MLPFSPPSKEFSPDRIVRALCRRITRRITRRIAAVAATEPGLLERTAAQARRLALESLGLAEIQAELEAITRQRQELDRRQRRAHRAMLAAVRRIPLEEASEGETLARHPQVARVVARAQAAQEEHLLGEHPAGREILRLRRERACLLETFWLAGAPRPLKVLWGKLEQMLGEEPTPLQGEALQQDSPPKEAPADGGDSA